MSNNSYGFSWDLVEVIRAVEEKGYKILVLNTPRQSVIISFTPTGLIRVGEIIKRKRDVQAN